MKYPVRIRKTFWGGLAVLAGFLAAFSAASAATSVTQHGITWTFDRDYQTGQFANGDYWVVGPVKITSISPRTTTSGGVTMHGSMINPSVNGPQGYDSRIKNNTFSSSHNVGGNLPLTLQVNTSLLSSVSNVATTSGDNPQINTIAILTVLPAAAPSGSFRPPPVGSNKTLSWNKSQLNYSKLRSLPVVANTPSLSTVEACFERPWIEQGTTWVSRYMHPSANQPSYGREIAHVVANGVLSLQLNYSNAQKEKLLVRMVQYGIDIYGSARLGGIWVAGGGHNHGRKMPMLLAAAVLGDANMMAYADGGKMVFQEDRQTFYVTQADVGRDLYTADGRPRVEYIQSDVGMAEWGEKHYQEPKWDGRNWDSYYRVVVGASITGHALAARMMGLKDSWKWNAFFDYIDRYYKIEASQASGSTNEIKPFVKSMWEAYRNSTSLPSGSSTPPPTTTPTPTPTPTPTNPTPTPTPAPTNPTPTPTPSPVSGGYTLGASWLNAGIASQTSSFTLSFDLKPLNAPMDAYMGVALNRADSHTDVAAAVRLAPNGYIDVRDGGSFRANTMIKYEVNKTYKVVMTINPSTKRYTVTVTPSGGTTVTIAKDYAFRTEQSRISSVNHFVGFGTTGKCTISSAVSAGKALSL